MRSCSGQNSGNVIKLWKFVLGTRFSGLFAEVSGDDLSQGPYGLVRPYSRALPRDEGIVATPSPAPTPLACLWREDFF